METDMKRVLILLLFVLVVGCADSGTPSSKHFKSLGNKTLVNRYGISTQYHLYAISGEFDLNALRELCRSTKTSATASITYMPVFDSASNARYSKLMGGGGYAHPDDVAAKKHIKALYTYIKSSGHSELELFPTNSYESVPKRKTIR
jgi:hypothetical protein